MSGCAALLVEAWRAGVELSVNGDKIHFRSSSRPPEELLDKLQERKNEMLRFLSYWIDTPYGQAKFWGTVL